MNGKFIKITTAVQEVADNKWKHLNTFLLLVDKKYYGTLVRLPEVGWVVMKKYTKSDKEWREIAFPYRVPPQTVIDLLEATFYSNELSQEEADAIS